jgi:hypothetical protein
MAVCTFIIFFYPVKIVCNILFFHYLAVHYDINAMTYTPNNNVSESHRGKEHNLISSPVIAPICNVLMTHPIRRVMSKVMCRNIIIQRLQPSLIWLECRYDEHGR